MSDYDHTDALRFRAEADRWQKEANALRAENAALKAQWASVPWAALLTTADFAHVDPDFYNPDTTAAINRKIDTAYVWINANAPKESAE